ncbi:MAG: metallophosphoesterase [Oscillospiraceae bacterium]|nr:metallophosphoesterase [Oscillospiraceae bacterium]
MKAAVSDRSIAPDRRVIVISDIHGQLDYLTALLDKVGYGGSDLLVIDGDFVEKGARSLDTLHYVMRLASERGAWVVCGNCDDWGRALRSAPARPDGGAGLVRYLLKKPNALLNQMCAGAGITAAAVPTAELASVLLDGYAEEFAFLDSLPTVIETEKYIFVHGGITDKPRAEWDDYGCKKFDYFLHTDYAFDKWVIVGHQPVMLYRESIVDANPIIDHARKIASIDGGCVLKDDGQLNALIIPAGGGEFECAAYDKFPRAKTLSAQRGGNASFYIRWGDAEVRVLRRGEEFSLVRHARTGYEMEVLTKYLRREGGRTTVNDCTDYVLPLERGDIVSVVERTSRGYFVKHGGVSGWYFGEIEEADK